MNSRASRPKHDFDTLAELIGRTERHALYYKRLIDDGAFWAPERDGSCPERIELVRARDALFGSSDALWTSLEGALDKDGHPISAGHRGPRDRLAPAVLRFSPRWGDLNENDAKEAVGEVLWCIAELRRRLGQIVTSNSSGSVAHSQDFASVNWFGKTYEFTKRQAACVRLLWAEWERGRLGLAEETIGEEVDSAADRFRLMHVFRDKSRGAHPAWETMIVRGGPRGVFRLAEPAVTAESPENHQ